MRFLSRAGPILMLCALLAAPVIAVAAAPTAPPADVALAPDVVHEAAGAGEAIARAELESFLERSHATAVSSITVQATAIARDRAPAAASDVASPTPLAHAAGTTREPHRPSHAPLSHRWRRPGAHDGRDHAGAAHHGDG